MEKTTREAPRQRVGGRERRGNEVREDSKAESERKRKREIRGIYDGGPTYVSTHYGPRGIKGAAFTTSHIQSFTAPEI